MSDMAGLPKAIAIPVFKPRNGVPCAGSWVYRDRKGAPVACVVRYNESNGKKVFSQCHVLNGSWVFKAHPEPRPLYNLPAIEPDKPILIVEGEKTCDYATKIAGKVYSCVTWSGGSSAILTKNDWSPLYGHKILIFPDADAPGRKVASEIAKILSHNCPEIKVVDTTGQPEGWDLADNPDWDWSKFHNWVKPRASIYAEIMPELIAPTPPPPSVTNNILIMPQQDETGNAITMKSLWEDVGIPMSGHNPINNIVAVNRVFNYDKSFANNIWYDEFYRNILINGEFLRDDHEIAITTVLQSRFGLSKMNTDTVRSAIIYHARQNIHNEPREYIKSLKWDGIPRVKTMFTTYFGTPDDQYHQDVAKYFMVSMVARIIDHGCQADSMIILTGNQGIKKSTALANLIGKKWFAVSAHPIGKPDFISSLQGKLLLEIGEMMSFRDARIEAVKMVCTNRVDRHRVPFDRHHQDLPRVCLFAGTTNEDQFLVDDENRRFYPICPAKCEANRISDDRDQLFAEALQIYLSDTKNWWIVTEDAKEHQENHRVISPWEEKLNDMDIFSFRQIGLDPYSGIKTNEILEKVFNIHPKDFHEKYTKKVTSALKKLGFRNAVTTTEGRKRIRVWRLDPPDVDVVRTTQKSVQYQHPHKSVMAFDE
jgi:putative DNA primase/helicase